MRSTTRSRRSTRPYVILNSAMSLDGKIATRTGESKLSSKRDLRRVHRLRSQVDGIIVGLGTILVDDPKLTVKYFRNRKPTRIIVDSHANTPPESYVIRTAKTIPTIIAVTSKAPVLRRERLARAGVRILVCGNGSLVSLRRLMQSLYRDGFRKLLLEGGGTLNWGMLSDRLVDHISVAVSPRVLGGIDAITLVDGEGFSRIKDTVRLRLVKVSRNRSEVVLSYDVLG